MEQLIELFKKFPGIGPRQAKRFVSFIMHSSDVYRRELMAAVLQVHNNVTTCSLCNKRYIDTYAKIDTPSVCTICRKQRDPKTLLIVAHDSDVDVFEKTMMHQGNYYVLGRYVPLFAEDIEEHVNVKQLYTRIDALLEKGLTETILATNATSDGDYTARILREYVQKKYPTLTVSTLGRGLSTGGELEYADSDTLREAMKFRR
jgi:recombination protein RecR